MIEKVPLNPSDLQSPPTEVVRSFEQPLLAMSVGSAEKAKKGEDSILVDENTGTFGVFDGVGGHGDGKKASQTTAGVFAHYFNEAPTDVASCMEKLKAAFCEANTLVTAPDQTMTTGTVLQIVKTPEGESHAVWGSVGDSRLYIHRDNEVTILTMDEGEGNVIHNAIGTGEDFYLKQLSSIKVKPGDKFMVCSDGITGDSEEQALSESELESAFCKASPQESAEEFLRLSKKNDDKSVIVISLDSFIGSEQQTPKTPKMESKNPEQQISALYDLEPNEVRAINIESPLEDRGTYKICAEIDAGGGEQARLLVLDIRNAPSTGAYKIPFGETGPVYNADFLVVDTSFFKSEREGDVKEKTGFKGIRSDGEEVAFGRNHQEGRFAFPRTVSGDHFSLSFDGQTLNVINKDPLNGTLLKMNQ